MDYFGSVTPTVTPDNCKAAVATICDSDHVSMPPEVEFSGLAATFKTQLSKEVRMGYDVHVRKYCKAAPCSGAAASSQPPQDPFSRGENSVMILYENTLIQFKNDIRRKKLVNFLCAEYESASKNTVSEEIRYAWKYTFQIIYSMLNLMGAEANPEAGIRIDLEEGEHARHLKLIFASGSSDVFHYSLLGLFAGSTVRLSKAEDIVVFREGSLQWSAVHPSMFMSSFARRLLRGSPEDGEASIAFECASWLFDCFFSCDSDIITDYKRQLTDEVPVFYANDTDELVQYLLPVLRQAGGLQALRKLSAIQTLSAAKKTVDRNEDQIYLISSITNNVLRKRKAWYIIEGQAGTGKGEIIKGVTDKLSLRIPFSIRKQEKSL